MESNLEASYKSKIAKLEQSIPFAVKEGEIVYINPLQTISEYMKKIEVGIDASYMLPSGKMEMDMAGCEVNTIYKTIFKQFEEGKFQVGDKVRVMLAVGGRQVNTAKNTGLPIIYNNVAICNIVLIEKAALLPSQKADQPEPEPSPAPFNPGAQEAIDDLPF